MALGDGGGWKRRGDESNYTIIWMSELNITASKTCWISQQHYGKNKASTVMVPKSHILNNPWALLLHFLHIVLLWCVSLESCDRGRSNRQTWLSTEPRCQHTNQLDFKTIFSWRHSINRLPGWGKMDEMKKVIHLVTWNNMCCGVILWWDHNNWD